jgi:peptidoglycan/LPS O-acetylase OafA/YrhL
MASTSRNVRAELVPSPRPAVADPTAEAARPRYHAFDALRAFAIFLVVGLHSALGYVGHDIPRVVWCIRDAPTSRIFDWFCWWSMGVSNPLYFTIAGFFAVLLYNARGFRGFVANRARRVLVPFVVAVATVLPLTLLVWIYGWVTAGRCTWRQARRIEFRDPVLQAERFGSGHLWFLEYLIVMLLAYAVARWLLDRRAHARPFTTVLIDRVIRSAWAPFLLAIPSTVLLWVSRYRVGIDAALDRHNSFGISPDKMAHYAIFFLVGTGLYRARHEFERFARRGPLFLGLSFVVFVPRAWLLAKDWTKPLIGTESLALAVCGALFSWLVVFGFIGASLRLVRQTHPAIRYLAESSYWIYLVHMPILGLVQVDLYRVPGHAFWKAPLVLAITLAVGFASYHAVGSRSLDRGKRRAAGRARFVGRPHVSPT